MIQPFIQNLFNSTLQMGEGENPQQIFTEQQGEDFQTLLANIGTIPTFEAQTSDAPFVIESPLPMVLNIIPTQQKPELDLETPQTPQFNTSEVLTTLEYNPIPPITIDDFIEGPEEIIIHDIEDLKYEEEDNAIAAVAVAPLCIEPAPVVTTDIKQVSAPVLQVVDSTEFTTTLQLTEQLFTDNVLELAQSQFPPSEKMPANAFKETDARDTNAPQFREVLEQSLSEDVQKEDLTVELRKTPTQTTEKIEDQYIQKAKSPILEKTPLKISNEVQISILPEVEQCTDPLKQEIAEIIHPNDTANVTEKPMPKVLDNAQVKQQIIEKVQVSVQKFRIAPKIDTLRFQLAPKELGSIDISFHLKANNLVSIEIKAEKKETLEVIQNASHEIRAIASEARMSVSDVELSFDLKDMTHDEPKKQQQAQKHFTYEHYVKRNELDHEEEFNMRTINTDNPISILI